MNWYLAKIVFRIICGDGLHQAQFDEQLRLIAASSESKAYEKACAIGKFEQDAFYNSEKKLVEWKFIGVPELHPFGALSDGAELFARIQEPEDAEAYTNMITVKSQKLSVGKGTAVSDFSFANAEGVEV
ncbi:MAG: DUF4288 domain-containing protein [Chitinophagales bacterium]